MPIDTRSARGQKKTLRATAELAEFRVLSQAALPTSEFCPNWFDGPNAVTKSPTTQPRNLRIVVVSSSELRPQEQATEVEPSRSNRN
jgi:hypothetical protein